MAIMFIKSIIHTFFFLWSADELDLTDNNMSSSSTPVSNTRSRVKLYTLNEERQWDDRGTGFVTCVSPTSTTSHYSIIVKSEIDGSTLLESEIQLNTKYQKQQVEKNTRKIEIEIFFPLGNLNRLV